MKITKYEINQYPCGWDYGYQLENNSGDNTQGSRIIIQVPLVKFDSGVWPNDGKVFGSIDYLSWATSGVNNKILSVWPFRKRKEKQITDGDWDHETQVWPNLEDTVRIILSNKGSMLDEEHLHNLLLPVGNVLERISFEISERHRIETIEKSRREEFESVLKVKN